VQLFDLPSGGGSWPDYIVAGPGGAMWFTEFYGDFIGRIAMDGTITTFPVPGGDAEGITIGGDGNIWFTEPGAQTIARMTPAGQTALFQLPKSQNESPRGITLGPDGNVWWAELYDGYIGRITPRGKISRFAVPEYQSGPWDIKAGPHGYLYFSESGANRIGRFDPRTLQFKPSVLVPTQTATPWGLLYAPDKHIWFTERTGNKIAELTSGGAIREFSIPQSNSYPEALAAADGNLWFTEGNATYLDGVDPKTGKFAPAVVLPSGSIPNGIAPGPNKNLWFCIDAYNQTNEIGELVLR
jgi:virginiamycin B lyase